MKISGILLFLVLFIYVGETILLLKLKKRIYKPLSIKKLKKRLNENKFLLGFAVVLFFVGVYLYYQEYLFFETFNLLAFLGIYTPLLYFSILNIFIIKKEIKQKEQAESE